MAQKDTYDFPSKLIKELQRLVAIVVVEKLHMQSSMQSAKQFEYCYIEYHGLLEDETIGLSELFLQGKIPFGNAFDETTVDVTDKDATTNKECTLKKLLSRLPDASLRVGAHLTTRLMLNVSKSKNSAKLAGHQIQTLGNATKTNVLKATAFADVNSKGNKGCTNPLGHNSSDLYHHIRDKMYNFECGRAPKEKMGENVNLAEEHEEEDCSEKKTSGTNNQSESRQATNNNGPLTTDKKNKRPEDWFFHGFMAFVLFSWYAIDQQQCLTILKGANFGKVDSTAGRLVNRNGVKAGRDKMRALEACRSGEGDNKADSPFKRGINLESRQQLAMLEQNQRKFEQREIENEVFVISQMITNQLAANEQRFRIAVRFGRDNRGRDDPDSKEWATYFKGVADVDAMQNKLIALNEKHEQAKHASTSKRSLALGLLGFVENQKSVKKQMKANNKDEEAVSSPVTASTTTASSNTGNHSSTTAAPPPPLVFLTTTDVAGQTEMDNSPDITPENGSTVRL